MIETREPDMNENIYRDVYHELWRFPYLPDKNRNEATVMKTIDNLFNSPTSVPIEYDGGYFVFRGVGGGAADLFWIHFPKRGGITRAHIRAAKDVIETASRSLDYITLKTADGRVMRVAKRIGFDITDIEKDGFEWHGEKMPLYSMSRIKEN